MAEEQKNPSDDDLLASAIPIDAADLEELEEVEAVKELDPADEPDLAPIEIDQTTEDQSGQTSSGRTIQTFGKLVGKNTEDALFMSVWV